MSPRGPGDQAAPVLTDDVQGRVVPPGPTSVEQACPVSLPGDGGGSASEAAASSPRVEATRLAGVKRLWAPVYADVRGSFMELAHQRRLADLPNFSGAFVQSNWSVSQRGVLRGLHYQARQPQGKLLQVLRGAIFDVTVDLRPSSPEYGRWQGLELKGPPEGDEAEQLWVPPGYAHGFQALCDDTWVLYHCTAYYDPADEVCLRWDDPTVGVVWPLADPILSDKDRRGLVLGQLPPAA